MDSERRRRIIRHLVADVGVASQDQIRTALEAEGFSVTQATISRDLAALGAHKAGNGADARYVIGRPNQANLDLASAINGFAISIRASANLVVVKTEPSAAGVVAGAIDRAALAGAIGTVAGDDTVLVIAAKPEGGAGLVKLLDPSATKEPA